MSFLVELRDASWVVWFVILAVIIFILWILVGGGDYEYVGLAPLKVGVDSTKYLDNQVCGLIERSNYNAEKVSGIDITPKIPTIINTSINEEPKVKEDKIKKDNSSKGEKICRSVIEEIYNKSFPKRRPNFLKNPETKRNLELDCYNDELKLAVEYNGIQHYKWPNFTNQSEKEFVKQIRRDKFKIEMCDLNGVYLITVPYNVPHNKIKEYIKYYLPENYHQRLSNEKNPNQVYIDLIDYDNDSNNFSDSNNSEDNSNDNSEDNSNNSNNNSSDDILQSYEVSFITNH